MLKPLPQPMALSFRPTQGREQRGAGHCNFRTGRQFDHSHCWQRHRQLQRWGALAVSTTDTAAVSLAGLTGTGTLAVGDGLHATTLQLNTTGGSASSQSTFNVNQNSTLDINTDSTSTATFSTGNVNGGIVTFTGTGSTTIGSLALNAGTFSVDPVSSTLSLTTMTMGSGISYAGGSQVSVTLGGSSTSTTLVDSGNLTRAGNGALIIAASGGIADLGSSEKFLVSGTVPAGQDGIVNPSIIGQDTTNNNGYFLSYGANGFVKATSGAATNINSASGEVYDAGTGSNTNTLSGNASVYAMNVENQTVDTAGHTLTLGDGTAGHQAGVILNGGSIISSVGSGVLNFGNNEGVIYTSSAGTPAISANIAGSDGAAFFGPGEVYLSGNNSTLSGGFNINQGTVNVTSGSALGTTGNTITLDGGTLQFSSSFSTYTSNLTDPIVVGAGGGTLDTQAGTVTISGSISASGTLTKVGSGTLALTASLTVGGGGSLQLDTAGGLTSIQSPVTVDANSALDIYTGSTFTTAISTGNTNNGSINVTGTGATTIDGVTGSGTLLVGDGMNATTLGLSTTSSSNSNQFSVTVNANSALNLYTDSTSSTTIGSGSTNNGNINVTGAGSITIGAVTGFGTLVVGDGTHATTLQLSTTGGSITSQSSFTVNANSTLDVYNDAASVTTFGNSNTNDGTIDFSGAGATSVGAIGGTGTFTVDANATLNLCTNSTSTTSIGSGNTNNGTLSVTGYGSASLAGINGTGTLVVGDGTFSTDTLQLSTTSSSTSTQSSVTVNASAALNIYTDSTSTTTIGSGSTNNGTLDVTGTGATTIGGVNGTGSLVIGDGTHSTLLQLSHESGASSVGSLTINSGSALDITNNHLFIDYGSGSDPMSTIYSYLKSGYNNGNWNGPGIISSAAQSLTGGHHYGIGFSDGKDNVVSGLSSGQIELKYTLLGDANLDGTVNGSDFSILSANYGLGDTNWDQGNFLYTSSVNGSDWMPFQQTSAIATAART